MPSSRVSGLLLHPTSLPGRVRHRRPRARGASLSRLPRGRRSAGVAGPAARPDRLRRLALPVLLGDGRQSAAREPRAPGARRAGSRATTSTPLAALPSATADFDRLIDAAACRARHGRSRDSSARRPRRSAPTSTRFRARAGLVARRLQPVHGAEGGARHAGLEYAGRRRCATVSRRRSTQARASVRDACRLHQFVQWQFFTQWAALRAAAAARGHRADGRHAHLRRARQRRRVGAAAISSICDPTASRASSRACRPTTSARPASCGATRSTAGTAWRPTATRGGSSACGMTLALVDRVRLDHFRGFVASWQVPGDATTAMHGEWQPGAGRRALRGPRAPRSGRLPIVAENLGFITPDVEALRVRHGLPGMAILQFAFGTDPQARDFLPHNYTRDRVAYTGTHDNDTILGWTRGGGRRQHAHGRRRRTRAALRRRLPRRRRGRRPALGGDPRRCSRRWPTRRSSRSRTCSAWAARRA